MENSGVKHGMALVPGKGTPSSVPPAPTGQVHKERVCFNPHPKTLTMAGDYEYFAAQGHHPLAFALAELVDNALRATKGNTARPRSIVVSLVVDAAAGRGLVAVRDNGVGMTPRELNAWAVMNLSMEDRGLLGADGRQQAGGRYLSGDISYFGVGSKNAAFYLGRTVKVVTRPPGGDRVHELCIRGDELERRFRDGEAVYEEEMVHRPPGTRAGQGSGGGGGGAQVLADMEEGFAPAAGWAAEEVNAAEPDAPPGHSFTRVVVGDLKPDVMAALSDEDAALGVLRDLAHLYHYYIHGRKGNAFITPEAREQHRHAYHLPGGEPLPDIVVELLTEACAAPCGCGAPNVAVTPPGPEGHGLQAQGVRWRHRLTDVDDDLESRYLKAQRASLEFSLDVPSHGTVEGVLWYFPFENDQETVPMDDATQSRMALTAAANGAPGGAGPSQGRGGCAGGPTQLQAALGGGGTQAGARGALTAAGLGATQRGGGKLGSAELEMQDAATARLLQASPLFEAFWQGRLIPGACVPSLTFIDAVRAKRTAAARDLLPDEVFGRIRGALFFGPGWRVTRNKLMFRDNLPALLADAVPADRHLERHFREWLTECHRSLDRSVRFEDMAEQAKQAQARQELGEDVTLFRRIHDGLGRVAQGDVVRLATKPQIVGKVLWFIVPRVVHAEGCYSHGKVSVAPLPPEMYGEGSRHTWPIRRIEGVVTKAEVAEHVGREMLKLPSSLRLEPLKLASGGVLQLAAGATLPESTAEVLSGTGQRLSRAFFGGHKQTLRVVQALYYLGPGTWDSQQTDAAGDIAQALTAAPSTAADATAAGEDAGKENAAPAEAAGSGKGKGAAAGGRKGRKRKPQEGEEGGEEDAGGGKRAVPAERGADEAAAAPATAAAADGSGKGRSGRAARAARRGEVAADAAAAAETAATDAAAASVDGPPATAGALSGKGGSGSGGSQELAPLPGTAEVVLRVENKTPSHDLFSFQKLKGGLLRAGRYLLEYSLLPELPGGRTLGRRIRLQVAPGTAASFELQGEGRAAAQARPLLLGEALPPLRAAFRDAVGNAAWRPPPPSAVTLQVLNAPVHSGGAAIPDLRAEASVRIDEDSGHLVLEGLRVIGAPPPGADDSGLSVFRPPAAAEAGGTSSAGEGACAQRDPADASAPVAPVELHLAVAVADMVPHGFPIRLRPGAPHSVELLPGHPFEAAAQAAPGDAGGDAVSDDVVQSTPLEGAAEGAPPAAAKAGGDAGGSGSGVSQPSGPAAPPPLAVVTSGDAVPAFSVRVLDAWGNPTAPTQQLPFRVAVASSGLDPQQQLFDVDPRGVATLSGLIAARGDSTSPAGSQAPAAGADGGEADGAAVAQRVHGVSIWPQVEGLPPPAAVSVPPPETTATQGKEAERAAAAAEEEALALGVVAQSAYGVALAAAVVAPTRVAAVRLGVLPSTMPARLVFVYQGEVLQMVEEPGEDDGEPTIVWVLSGRPGLEAGARAEGLALRCLDEVGRPSRLVKGKLQVSWAKGSSKRGLGGDDVKLPPLNMPEVAGEATPAWVRFNADPKGPWPDMILEVGLRVVASPGPPASWSMARVEYGKAADAAAEAADLSLVACGQPFYLEVQALDKFSNKCCLPPDQRPEPRVAAVHENPSAPLQLENKRKWSQTQAGTDACVVKLCMAGPVGAVRLTVRDEAGEEGASLLSPDELTVTLAPGPPAALAFDGPAQLQCGTRGVLGDLRLRAVDSWANLAVGAPFEVALNGCALPSEEGNTVAAKVTVAGSNRAKVKDGVAVFKGVKLSADAPGTYVLRAASATRKVALSDATLAVSVARQNFVAGISVSSDGLPAEGTAVGGALTLRVEVSTEDGAPLPWDAAAAGLQLRLEPADGSSKGAAAGAPRVEAMTLLPDEEATRALAEAAAASAGNGDGGDEPAAAASARAVAFVTPALTAAGRYRATAQFTETRTELLQCLPKADRVARSPAVEFSLAAGAPEAIALEGPSAATTAATVSNAADAAQRRILRQVAIQLRDGHGNPVPLPGVRLRWRLTAAQPDAAAGDGADGAAAATASSGAPPELECEAGALEAETDERGRAFFGDVLVASGTGRVDPGAAGGGLECELALGAKLPGRRWTAAWRCAVLFTDDAARAEAIRALQAERDALHARLITLRERVQEASRRADGNRKEAKAAARTAERCARQLGLQELPPTSHDAAAALQSRREAAATVEERPPMPASYGPPSSGMTQAIQRCLVSNDPDLVGVFAQLVTVEDRRLAEVVSAAYLGAMQVVVVKTYDCIARLRAMLGAAEGAPTPSMLSYTLIQPFSAEGEGRAAQRIRMRGVSELARRLEAEATEGVDGPLPMVLPHTRMLSAMQERGHDPPRGADLAADQWPEGCLGFVVNLLRPAVRGHRATVMYAQLGRSLVFETMEQAARYRQLVTQVLRTSMADVFTLDGQKISGRGVVVGSSFRVPPLEETAFRFGSRGGGGGGGGNAGGGGEDGALSPQQEEVWQALVAALEQREAAEQAADEATAAAEAVARGDNGEEDEGSLKQRMSELNERIKQQQQQQQRGKRASGAAAGEAPERGGGEEGEEEGGGGGGGGGRAKGKRRKT